MHHMLKVFALPAEQDELARNHVVIERYAGFVLLDVTEPDIAAISARYPVEDITSQFVIRSAETEIDTSRPRIDRSGKQKAHPAYVGAGRLSGGAHHYLVQFVGPIKDEWLRQVEAAGGELRTPFGGFTYVVRATPAARAGIAALACVRWLGHYRHEERIDPSVQERAAGGQARQLPRTKQLPDSLSVEFFDAQDMAAAVDEIRRLGFEVTSQEAKAAVATVRDPAGTIAAERLADLSAVHGVWRIRSMTLRRTSNNVAAGIMGTAVSIGGGGLGLSAAGETIAIADTGLDTGNPASVHPDFQGRIEALLSYPMAPGYEAYVSNPGADDGPADLDSGHGTHVTGSVLGNGSASANLAGVSQPVRGLASGARLVFQAIEQEMKWLDASNQQRYGRYLLTGIPNDLKTLFGDAYDRGARIHSNSWGGGDPGAYDAQCEQLDEFVWGHKDFCVLFANGNDGSDADGNGVINPMSVSAPATAKNCISVGASENLRPGFDTNTYGGWWPGDYPVAPYRNDPMANNPDQMAAFSSRGPTRDGRIKPDVAAPGTYILSTRSTMIASNNQGWSALPQSRLYFYMGGTSMATPLTAGAVALVREYLRTRQAIANPSAALLKATLIAGARRVPGSSPPAVADHDQGYGHVNIDAVLAPPAPATARFLDASGGLRTGEVFTDTLSLASAGAPLRVAMVYSDFPGPNLINNLNLVAIAPDGTRYVGNVAPGGALSVDAVNNVEVLHIPNPAPGSWTVQVIASNVPQGPQDFALVALGHFGAPVPAPAPVIDVAATPMLAIPDNSPQGVSSTLHVTQAASVASVQVSVDITHTYIGDLRVLLTAPDQQRITLHSRTGSSTHDLRKTYDATTTPDLVQLIGVATQGDWTLTVIDAAAIDVGTLNTWRLQLTRLESDPFRAASTPGVQIPDNVPAGISDAVSIAGTGSVGTVRVTVDITHTYIGDLRISVRSPSGRNVTLHDRAGGSADNILQTYDAASVPALATFAGEPTAGTWTLFVADLEGRDVGKLNRWELSMTAA